MTYSRSTWFSVAKHSSVLHRLNSPLLSMKVSYVGCALIQLTFELFAEHHVCWDTQRSTHLTCSVRLASFANFYILFCSTWCVFLSYPRLFATIFLPCTFLVDHRGPLRAALFPFWCQSHLWFRSVDRCTSGLCRLKCTYNRTFIVYYL